MKLLHVVDSGNVDRYHVIDRSDSRTDRQAGTRAGNAGIWDNTNWNQLADNELQEALRVADNVNKNTAKNVIMFIGDGMGVSTYSTARLYYAENKKLSHKDIYLSFEKLPHVGLSRVILITS